MPIGIMLKSKIVRETLTAKSYDLNQVETGNTQIDEDLMRLIEKLADDNPVIEKRVGRNRKSRYCEGMKRLATKTL